METGTFLNANETSFIAVSIENQTLNNHSIILRLSVVYIIALISNCLERRCQRKRHFLKKKDKIIKSLVFPLEI